MSRTRTNWRRRLLGVYCALVFAFLIAPLFIVFPLSVSSATYLRFPPPGLSLQWYEHYFSSSSWMQATLLSFEVAIGTAILSLLIGVPLSFYLARARSRLLAALVDKLVILPLVVPGIVIAVSVYGLFSSLHLIGNGCGLVVGHTVLALPFVVVVVTAALRTFDRSLEDAAVGLGASRLQAVAYVTLPRIASALLSGAFLAFMASFDDLIMALFLAGSNMTLPKKTFENILYAIDPTIAAVSALQILFVTILGGIWYAFRRGPNRSV